MLFNCGVGEDSCGSLVLQGDPSRPSQKRSVLGVSSFLLHSFSTPVEFDTNQYSFSWRIVWFVWVPRVSHWITSLQKALQNISYSWTKSTVHLMSLENSCINKPLLEISMPLKYNLHLVAKVKKVNTWWGRTFKILETAKWLKAICCTCNKSVINVICR